MASSRYSDAEREVQSYIAGARSAGPTPQQQAAQEQERIRKEQAKQAEELRKQQEAQQREAQARQVRQAQAADIETQPNIETGRTEVKRHDDGAPVFKPGKVGEPFPTPTVDQSLSAVPGMGDIVESGALGRPKDLPGGKGVGSEWNQTYRDDRGNKTTAKIEPKTDTKTGVQTVGVPNAYGQQVEQTVGIDRQVARKTELDTKRAELDLRGNHLDLIGGQIRPAFSQAEQEEKKAQTHLESLNKKGFERDAATGRWFKITESGQRNMADPVALTRWQKERADAEMILKQKQAERAKLQPGWDNYERAKGEHERARLSHQREAFANQYGFDADDETIADLGSRVEAAMAAPVDPANPQTAVDPATTGATRDLVSAADPAVPVVKTNEPEVAALQGAAEASKQPEANLLDATASTAIAKTPEAAQQFARDAFAGLNEPERLKVQQSPGGAFQLIRDGHAFGFVNHDGDQAWIELTPAADNPNFAAAANIGAKKGVPLYLGTGTDNRLTPKKAAEWAIDVSRIASAPLEPGETPAARNQKIQAMGASRESIQRAAADGDIPVQLGESLVQRLYGKESTLRPTDLDDEAEFQKWIEQTSRKENEQHVADYGTPARETVGSRWAASKTNLQERNEIRREYISQWYAANRGKPGVTRVEAQRRMGQDIAGEQATTGEKAASAGKRAGRFLRDDVVGSMAGLFVGALKDVGAAEVALFGNDAAAKELSESMRLRNRDFANWTNAANRNLKVWTSEEGARAKQQLDLASSALQRTIDEEWDKAEPDREKINAAAKAAGAAALAMHNLAPDESWPVTADSLDPDKDAALGTALAKYAATADPRYMQLYKERLLMNNGRRQFSAELEKRTAGKGSFGRAFTGGMTAGWQEVGTELLADAAALFTAGGSKALQATLRVAGAEGAALRIANLSGKMGRAVEMFEKAGTAADSLVAPLSRTQRALNQVGRFGKTALVAGAGEGGEEVLAEVGADNPDFVGSFLMGAAGGLMLSPGFHVAGRGLAKLGEGQQAAMLRSEDAKFSKSFNAAMADTPGFKPITSEQAGIARSFVNASEFQNTAEEYAQAQSEFDAARAAMAEQDVDPAAAKRSAGARTQLEKVRTTLADQTLQPERRAKLESAAADLERAAGPEADDAGSLNRLMQARQKLDAAFSKASAQTVGAVDAVNEISAIEDPAQQTFYRGIAKVATGNEATLTQNERQAITGAKTKAGANFFAEVPVEHGVRTVLTDEARAELRADMPALGKLVRTTESDALFESQISPLTPTSNEQNVQGQPGSQGQSQAPVPVSAVPARAAGQENPVDAGGQPEAAGATQAQAEAPVGANPAALDAIEYASMQLADPSMPDVAAAVQSAFSSGRPVSVSMARAAQIEVPEGYMQDGAILRPVASGSVEVIGTPVGEKQASEASTGEQQTTPENKKSAETFHSGAENESARSIAEQVKARVEADMPSLRGKVVISPDAESVPSGGAVALPNEIRLVLPDIARELRRTSPEAMADGLHQIVARHEVVHLVQYQAIEEFWREADTGQSFQDFFRDWYGRMAGEISQEAFAAAREIYGAEAWDAITAPAYQAAELVRMLVEAKLDPSKADEFSELFRAIRAQRPPTLIETLRKAVEMLIGMIRDGRLPESAKMHVDQVEALYRELTGDSVVKESLTTDTPAVAPSQEETESKLGDSPGDEFAPMRVIGLAIKDAAAADPRLTKKARRELEFAVEDLDALLETLPAEQRRGVMDDAIRAWLDEKFPAKQPRTIDAPARTRAYQTLNAGDYPTLSKIFESGKIAPRPSVIGLILSRKKNGQRLTTREIEAMRNASEYDDAVFQNQFENSGNGKVAREIVSLIMAKPGAGMAPDQMAAIVGEGLTSADMWARVAEELGQVARGQRPESTRLDPNREWTPAEIAEAEAQRQNAGEDVAARQAQAFDAANTAENGEGFHVEDFTPDMVGITVTVDGEPMRVTSVEMDSLGAEAETVVLDDHLRFGRQVLEGGDVVYLENPETEEALFSSPSNATSRAGKVDMPDALVAHELGAATQHPAYAAAKSGDRAAALRLARDMVTPKMRAEVKAMIGDAKPVIVPVLAVEESGHNMVPAAVAIRLEETLGLRATADIHQSVKAQRSGKSALDRIFSQPAFEGPVTPGESYLLVDDTLTQGGTFAALADHITRSGGKVVGAVALTGKQYSATLRLSEGLLTQLRERLGDVENDFRRATGYGFEQLTESEARTLVKFRPLERVRDRILEEGNARVDGLDAGSEGQAASPLGSSPQQSFDFGTSSSFATKEQRGFDFTSNEGEEIKAAPAEAVESAAAQTDTDPTDGQKDAGNYRKGKVTLHGLRISIENPKGSTRSGADANGKPWSNDMAHHYGYILGTEARDGDHVDAFIGENPDSTKVFIVNQRNVGTGRFDEHKVMLGFDSRQAAIDGYHANYAKGWKGLGSMVETDVAAFKGWLENGDTKKAATLDALKAVTKPAQAAQTVAAPAGIQDFGQKLGGARKDRQASIAREIGDEELAGAPFSKIWPKADVETIGDNDMAAIAHAVRSEVPRKPTSGYKVRRWVEQVKQVRNIMRFVEDQGAPAILDQMRQHSSTLSKFADKITVLRAIPREHWDRVGEVSNHPNAYYYEGDAQVPSPFATMQFDGKRVRAESLDALAKTVNDSLGKSKESPRMQFEVRTGKNGIAINKKGDPLYRPLRKFEDAKDAFAFIRERHDDLVAAWEAVKDSDNVKETDVRKKDNRPRTGADHRQGKDATAEMFTSAFGFRGVEFGNWVSQGANAKERQGMLNQAYDALYDLANILGIPPRAISLNGALGIGFGSRGSGKASAHYEPSNLVINLTKTRGAGTLAHEWFHALDHYFQRQRPGKSSVAHGGDYITYQPERYYEDARTGHRLSESRFRQIEAGGGRFHNINDWKPVEGVRPEVEQAFVDLVKSLNDSPMAKRSALIDKGKSNGYWSRVIERAARSFENYVIHKMQLEGYHNDYLANVTQAEDFSRDAGRYPYLLPDEIAPVATAFDDLFSTIKTKETDTGMALFASPSPESNSAVNEALAKMPPIYRQVFEAVSSGATPAEVMKRFDLTDRAVTNILNQVRSRMASVTQAAGAAGLSPVMRGDKIDGGRPDLALSTIPEVAAIDQIRNESGVPDVRGWEEVNEAARKQLDADYKGTYDALLAKARELQPLSDQETAAVKMILARETMEGRTQSAADRVKLALLIHGYRDVGTETARSLAIRRDPHKKPAERHAQILAEALFTPDPATRARLRKAAKGDHEAILAGWLSRVDSIKAELLAQGIDIDASLAAFNSRERSRKRAEAESPRATKVIDDTVRRLTKREKMVIEAIRSGSKISNVAFLTGMEAKEVIAVYTQFTKDIRSAMAESAKRFLENSLASSPSDLMTQILSDLGLPPLEDIDDTAPGYLKRQQKKEESARKKRQKEAAKMRPVGEPDMTIEEWAARPPSTWRTLWQTEMQKLRPQPGISFEEWAAQEFPVTAREYQRVMDLLSEDQRRAIDDWANQKLSDWKALWQTEMKELQPQSRISFEEWAAQPMTAERWRKQGEMFPEPINETTGDFKATNPGQEEFWIDPINETTGTFDLNDPLAVKQVMDAFAVTRGTAFDKVLEFWRMSILSGPQTHVVNMGSNILHTAYQLVPRRVLEAGVNGLLGAVKLGSDRAATFGEFSTMAKVAKAAAVKAGRNAIRSWRSESRVSEAQALGVAQEVDFTGVKADYIPPAIGGKLGKVMRSISFRALTAADEMLKTFIAHTDAAAQAHRIAAKEEKLTGDAYDARIAELMEPGSVAWVRAIDEAERITFQRPLDAKDPRLLSIFDRTAEAAKRVRGGPWGKALTFVLPFIDTPSNMVKLGIEMSPLGTFVAVIDGARALKQKLVRGNLSKAEADKAAAELYDKSRFVQDITNQIVAWGTFWAVSELIQGDDDDDGRPWITGTMPWQTTSRGERDTMYRTMPPQSIRLGGTVLSYKRVEPFATAFTSMVDFAWSIRRNQGLNEKALSDFGGSFRDQLKDKTFLQGIGDVLNAIEDPQRFLSRLSANIATGFVPNIIRQPIRSVDPMVRDTSPREADGLTTAIAKRLGYSVVPQYAPLRLDVWGNPLERVPGEPIGGGAVTDAIFRIFDPTNASVGAKPDPIDLYILRWNLQQPDRKTRLNVEPIRDYVDGTKDGKRVKMAISVEEQAEANRSAGKAAREALGDGWDYNNPTAEGIEQIDRVIRQAQKIERSRLRIEKLVETTPGEE